MFKIRQKQKEKEREKKSKHRTPTCLFSILFILSESSTENLSSIIFGCLDYAFINDFGQCFMASRQFTLAASFPLLTALWAPFPPPQLYIRSMYCNKMVCVCVCVRSRVSMFWCFGVLTYEHRVRVFSHQIITFFDRISKYKKSKIVKLFDL